MENAIKERDGMVRKPSHSKKTVVQDIPSRHGALSLVIGVWVMASPDILGGSKTLSDSNYLTGALIVTFSFIALSEVGRITRFLNLFAGLWLVIGSWFLGPTETLTWSAALMGALLVPLSIPLGKIRETYGTYDKWVYWPPKRAGKRSFNFKLRHEH